MLADDAPGEELSACTQPVPSKVIQDGPRMPMQKVALAQETAVKPDTVGGG